MSPDSRRRAWIGRSLATVLIALSGTRALMATKKPGQVAPATLGFADAAGVKTVTFTADAAQRFGCRRPGSCRPEGVAVHYAALIYDKKGQSWVVHRSPTLDLPRMKVTVDGSRRTGRRCRWGQPRV